MKLDKYEGALAKAGFTVSGDLISNVRGDVVAQVDPYGGFHCADGFEEIVAIMSEVDTKPKKAKAKKVEADG